MRFGGGIIIVPALLWLFKMRELDAIAAPMLAMARDLGADCLATGHYVRRVPGPAGSELHRALDPARDRTVT